MNHCVVFDIGKTNKKCFVFDEDYRMVWEKSTALPETADEDGFPCEDVFILSDWIRNTFREVLNDPRFNLKAVDATTYGASLVHLDADGKPAAPLYNYLKPFPEEMQKHFFQTYGPPEKLALETASPVLGNLNSGLQLYWLKHRRPEVFQNIKTSLHLPQYAAALLQEMVCGKPQVCTESTSLGCHTFLWDFRQQDYHSWVKAEGLDKIFAPLCLQSALGCSGPDRFAGNGWHDSSSALMPYLSGFDEPFLLISTGTWCISLNPFNHEPLTPGELEQDCLCYLTAEGKPVKAARFFGGHEHDMAVTQIARDFGVSDLFYQKKDVSEENVPYIDFQNALQAYATFMRQLVEKQVISTKLALGVTPVRRIFVDGGFSNNKQYMAGLAAAFPGMEIYAAEIAQATALGAALACHRHWNTRPLPTRLISLKKYHA